MFSETPLEIYKASAGSGKTYLLTMQYLQLLLQYPGKYRHILAVTFTNKATAEMKERILGELKKIARGEQTSYSNDLLKALPAMDAGALQQRAKEAYSDILHDYSRFAVSTIDSFVQRIIRSFAYEIGLDSGFRLQLNTQVVKEDLADRLFKLLDTDKTLRQWVATMAMEQLEEGKSWNFRNEMLGLADELFKEPFQEFDAAIKSKEDAGTSFEALRKKIGDTIDSFEKQWKATGEKAVRLIEENALSKEDFHFGKSGFVNYFYKAARGDMDSPGNRAEAALENPDAMAAKKSSAHAKATISAIQSQLATYLGSLIRMYQSEERIQYNTAQAIARNLDMLRLMMVFGEQLSRYRSENNVLLISDTHLLLRQLTADTDASFIYEKIGNRFRHFLIDEFQDTSGFQWDNFKPLLENALAENNYNLLVGDVKQAIYRWRNGDMNLLQSKVQQDLKNTSIAVKELNDNYRSAAPVIDFNNYLYAVAPALMQDELNALIQAAPQSIQQTLLHQNFDKAIGAAYAESFQQKPPAAPEQGMTSIQFIAPDTELNYNEQVLPLLHESISHLLSSGFQPKDIAILTRKGKEASMVIEYLMQAQQAEASVQYDLLSAEALLLRNNSAVHLLLSALQWLSHTECKLSLVQLRQAVRAHLQLPAGDEHVFLSQPHEDRILPPAFAQNTGSLRQLAIPELLNELIRLFELQCNSNDAAYLLALQDVAADWSRYGNEGIQQFLKYWETEGQNKSLPGGANTNAIEVLTIHKSKGLAFTVLLLPFLNWELKPDAKKSIQLWVNAAPPFDEIATLPVKYSKKLQDTQFAQAYFKELKDGMLDNLNLLYVATTRARRRILGWAPLPDKTDGLSTLDKLLYKMASGNIAASRQDIPNVQSGFDATTNTWVYGSDDATATSSPTTAAELLPPLVYNNWQHKLTVRYKPLLTEQQEQKQLPRQQGILLHETMALLPHPSRLEETLQLLLRKGLLTDTQLLETKRIIEKMLQQPLFERWRNGTMQRMSEREIITPARALRRPDLVLYSNEETLVIDFKFSEDKAKATQHEAQVKEYADLLQQMGFPNLKGFVFYALMDEVSSIT